MFRENEIIVLLGAGCSADAGIITSKDMVKEVEQLLGKQDWAKFRELFNYAKSSINYADGIKGKFSDSVDIERLVNVLAELEKKDSCILFPFIGGWDPKLVEIAGYKFEIVTEFREKIVNQLSKWVTLDDDRMASYFTKFYELATEYNYSLRVFSLNYDLCLEKHIPQGMQLERGFDQALRTWDWRRFEPREEYQPNIYLYKLHGSLDWEREEEKGNIIREVDKIPDSPDLIFGVDYKLQYIDPYLFYAYEFRKYSLESKVILVIGYSFNDEHINGILRQAISSLDTRKLYVVDLTVTKEDVESRLPWKDEKQRQIIVKNCKAKEFLEGIDLATLENNVGP